MTYIGSWTLLYILRLTAVVDITFFEFTVVEAAECQYQDIHIKKYIRIRVRDVIYYTEYMICTYMMICTQSIKTLTHHEASVLH